MRASRQNTKHLRLDWLFSYQPTPGTVFFAGYGTSLVEQDTPLRGRQPDQRLSDGFFAKISYHFRLQRSPHRTRPVSAPCRCVTG